MRNATFIACILFLIIVQLFVAVRCIQLVFYASGWVFVLFGLLFFAILVFSSLFFLTGIIACFRKGR